MLQNGLKTITKFLNYSNDNYVFWQAPFLWEDQLSSRGASEHHSGRLHPPEKITHAKMYCGRVFEGELLKNLLES